MAGGSRRLTNLDALRGVAVLLMIEQHVGIWLWAGPGPDETRMDYPVLVAFNAAGGFGGPLFFSLAGAGSALYAARNEPGTDLRLLKRGLLVLAFGYAMNFTAPSWFSWGSWFALHLMGFGIAASFLWRRLPDLGLALVAAGLLLGAPFLQSFLQTPDDIFLDELRDTTRPGGMFRLMFAEGQYPLFPWLSIVVLGFASGRFIAEGRERGILWIGIALTVAGAVSYGLHLGLEPVRPDPLYFATRLKLGFFPASISMVCLISGPAFVLLWAVTRVRALAASNPVVTSGRASLTVFFLHVPIFRELSRPVGLWSGLTAGPTLAVVIGLIALCLFATRMWQRVGFRYGAEWLLRRLTP